MSEPTQLVPTLTIIEDAGEFTVRVGAQDNAKQIAQKVVPLLAGLGATKLLLITPFDTKVYKFDSPNGKVPYEGKAAAGVVGASGSPQHRRVISDEGAPPSAEDATLDFEKFVAEEREAERVRQEMERTVRADPGLPAEEEAPAPVKRGRAPKEQIEPAGAACGRCQGAGTIAGGGACPVCRGKGVIAKWGGRRR